MKSFKITKGHNLKLDGHPSDEIIDVKGVKIGIIGIVPSNIDKYFLSKNIDGITGATISANSISKGIHKITILYPLIKDQLINE